MKDISSNTSNTRKRRNVTPSPKTTRESRKKLTNQNIKRVKNYLNKHALAIQKLATDEHTKLIGSDPVPKANLSKYAKSHANVIKEMAKYLDNYNKGIKVFNEIGETLAKESLNDGLTIEEAVNGTIFQKQAIWRKLEEGGILVSLSREDVYGLSQTIGRYCDVLASKTAFSYHNHFITTTGSSEARFRALIEKSSDAVALVTKKGNVLYASPSTKAVMGYTPEEFKELPNPFLLVPPNERRLVTKLFEKLIKKPGKTEMVSYRVVHKNGNHIWIESAMTNMLTNPNINAVVINYHDITQRKTLETQKNEFISIATHELKTPVTSIKAYAQLLHMRFLDEGNNSAAHMLSKLDGQVTKLLELINDLLDVTRVDAGKMQFHYGTFDFNALVMEVVEEMQLIGDMHDITHKLGMTRIIAGDRNRLGQVISNLLSNAIRYSKIHEKIVISTTTNKKDVTLCVKDSGVGIKKKDQAKIFDRFYRVGNSLDVFAGLGLGLYISSEIIKHHGGRMWVESKKGKGSLFCFTVPVHAISEKKKIKENLTERDPEYG